MPAVHLIRARETVRRAPMFATGQGRKTGSLDAHGIAVAALRTDNLHQVIIDDITVALRLIVDRRELLGRTRTKTPSRLHHHLLTLVEGGEKSS